MGESEEKYSPGNFPYADCEALGEIKAAFEECPGVFYISALAPDDEYGMPREYYVVEEDAIAISEEAKQYGEIFDHKPMLHIYDLDDPDSGHYVIEYEINRYRVKNNLPLDEGTSLLASARYAMEYHPEYFGEIVPPLCTPLGHTTRYKSLMRGVFWLETDEAEECIAVFYPIWESNFSEYTAELAVFTARDAEKGIQNTLGYAFYSMIDGCLPVFELWNDTEKIHEHVDYIQLMNAIWKDQPEYALAWNAREQKGLNDIHGLFMHEIGLDVTLRHGAEASIKLTEGAGTEYLIL